MAEPELGVKRRSHGRSNISIYDHFSCRTDLPKKHNYFMIECRHCWQAYEETNSVDGRTKHLLSGRLVEEPRPFRNVLHQMENHVERCFYAQAAITSKDCEEAQQQPSSRVSSSSKSSSPSPFKPLLNAPLFVKQAEQFKMKLLQFTIAAALPFSWVHLPEAIAMFDCIQKVAIEALPTRKELAGPLLLKGTEEAVGNGLQIIKQAVKSGKTFLGLSLDGYETLGQQHFTGVSLHSGGFIVPYLVLPGGDLHHGIAIAQETEEVINRVYEELGLKVSSICTNDAGQCGRAHRILALRHRSVVLSPCMAHMVNNLMRQLLNLELFTNSVSQATLCVNVLHASSSKWLVRARNSMAQQYGKCMEIMSVSETRWSSSQMMMASLLRVKTALQSFFLSWNDHVDFPSALHCLGDSRFWIGITHAKKLVQPLAFASFDMERDTNSVGDVFFMFGSLSRHLAIDTSMVQALEDRWEKLEQPLYVLGSAADPKKVTVLRQLVTELPLGSKFSASCLALMAHSYYQKYLGADPQQSIVEEVFSWLTLDAESDQMLAFKDQYTLWRFQSEKFPLWSKLAIFLLSVVTQSATCERMFKDFARFHTESRNRLHLSTTERLVQLRKFQLRAKTDRDHAEKKRVVMPTELEKISCREDPAAAELQKSDHPDCEDGDAVGVEDENFGHLADDNPFVILSNWKAAIDAMASTDNESGIPTDGLGSRSIAVILESLDDRRPWPANNDKSFPQEILSKLPEWDLRCHKSSLVEWFANLVSLDVA